jgi:uncharacterized membrane protein YcaP (DUF421 family)
VAHQGYDLNSRATTIEAGLRAHLRTPPARLARDSRILAAGLRRKLMTRDELMAQLRKQGIEDVGGQIKGRGSRQTGA